MDVAGAISTVTAAIGFARELNNVNIQVDQAALKLKIAELTGALADAKLGLVDIADELRRKDAEIARLADLFAFKKDQTIHRKGWTYDQMDGEPVGLPYCPVCEQKGKFIHVILDRTSNKASCPSCRADLGRPTRFLYPDERS